MPVKYNKDLKLFSRDLRKNMTEAERILWSKIRRKQINNSQFYRQKPIGEYIVDFYCLAVKLIIEIDGGQHYEIKNEKKDKQREEKLKQLGFKILRFTNLDALKNIDGVLKMIKNYVDS